MATANMSTTSTAGSSPLLLRLHAAWQRGDVARALP